MLTRKCGKSICNLLVRGDYDLKIAIIPKKTSRFTKQFYIDWAWKEIFKSTIGEEILNDRVNTYLVSIQTELAIDDFSTEGNQIIEELWTHVEDLDVVRLEITKCPSDKNKVHSYIIARE